MTRPADPRVSVIIPVYNWASLTQQVLEHLLADPPAVPHELVAVDDGSRDLTPRLLAGYGDRIRAVTHRANAGYATACNDGATVARGEYLVFLNNDTLPRPGWLDALVRYADAHPRAAVVGSKMLRPDGTTDCTGVVMGRLVGGEENVPIPLYYGLPGDHPAVNKSRPFQMVTGACMLVRRALFRSVGGLDRAYVNGREDVDLCLKLRELGHEVHYCHESEVVHLGSMTRWSKRELDDPLGDVRHGVALFQQRWAHRIPRDDIHYFVEDGLLSVGYIPPFRIQVGLSPRLGTLQSDEYDRESDHLLEQFAMRTFELMRENHRLQTRLREADLRALASASPDDAPLSPTWHAWLRDAPDARRRELVSALYLQGSGIQLGPPETPLPVPRWVTIRQAEQLPGPDASHDFVIAPHFDALTQDPETTLAAIRRVLKPGGIAHLTLSGGQTTLTELLAAQGADPGFDLELVLRSEDELIVVLRRTSAPA